MSDVVFNMPWLDLYYLNFSVPPNNPRNSLSQNKQKMSPRRKKYSSGRYFMYKWDNVEEEIIMYTVSTHTFEKSI